MSKIQLLDLFSPLQRSDDPSKEFRDYWKYARSPSIKDFYSNEKTGKWCIFVNPRSINNAWKKIKLACAEGKLMVAKTSTAKSSGTKKYPKYIICVYNNDWSNSDEVQSVRQVLKDLGFTKPLKYKTDLNTMNGVYGDDEYMIDEEKMSS